MDSEDDMHDSNDVDSLDDDFYSGETAMYSDDDEEGYPFGDNDSDDSDETTSHRQQVEEILDLEQENNGGDGETRESTPTGNASSSSRVSKPRTGKRKSTSYVWAHYVRLPLAEDNIPRCKCRSCGTTYQCASSQGTDNFIRHLKSCNSSKNHDICQMFLTESESSLSMRPPKFNLEVFREKIYLAMVRHDLPFRFVEYDGVKDALRYINEGITLGSRNTAKAAIIDIYNREKLNVKKMLDSIPGRISFTTDLWTSITSDGYIALTAHFIDQNWKLQKRVLNFRFMPTPHTGAALCEAMCRLLNEWGVDKKVFSLTLDNASSNDLMVELLKGKLNVRNALLSKGELLQVRCSAHVLNLVVQDGLKVIDCSVYKIRDSVKYLKGSQVRRQQFLECVKQKSLNSRRGLRQDVPTRWNSTFLMLESALYYRRAFKIMKEIDSNYKCCPKDDEWDRVEKICKFLGVFYKVTCLFSGSDYPTSNLYFPQVFLMQDTLTKGMADSEIYIRVMATEMYAKFEKYWSNYSVILAIVVVFDPRYKLQFVEWCYDRLYGNKSLQIEEFHRKLSSLFNEYMQNSSKTSPTTSNNPQDLNNDTLISQDGMDSVLEDFDSFDGEDASTIAQKTQLELYLAEPRMERKKELDVLQFWKGNQCRYPELSSMARDLLAIPVSSVASEAAFSVGGRVINKFRSSLKPANVEALLCTRDWIYGKQFEMEVELEELCEDVMTMDGATVDGSPAT